MSRPFKVSVEVQGYEVKLGLVKFSVEGTKEDAPEIAQRIERQLSGMVQAPAVMAPTALTPGNGNASPKTIDAVVETDGGKKKKSRKPSGGGTKTSADEFSFVHDSGKYGTPQQGWTTTEKSIWFLYVVGEQASVKQQTAYGIMKNFNKYFKAAGQINNGNIMKALEKEKIKGATATVGTDVSDGTAKYFLTQAGIAMAERMARGESAAAAGAA